jgi:hypothetical protein
MQGKIIGLAIGGAILTAKVFLQMAGVTLEDLDALERETNRFDAVGPILNPEAWFRAERQLGKNWKDGLLNGVKIARSILESEHEIAGAERMVLEATLTPFIDRLEQAQQIATVIKTGESE